MRITAGQKRGATLHGLESVETRPTLDHVKEAVFSMVGNEIVDATVLDLYAGSGAIGLESLSRGAKFAVFVDDNSDAIKIIHKNIEKLSYCQNTLVLSVKDNESIDTLSRKKMVFNMIYMDPPFGKTNIKQTLEKLLKTSLIAENGFVIIEEEHAARIVLDLQGLVLEKDKRYGRISIRVLRRVL